MASSHLRLSAVLVLAAAGLAAATPTADDAWHPMGDGLAPQATWGMISDGPAVWITGDLTQVDGVAVNHVAHWDGATWTAVGSGLDDVAGDLVRFGPDMVLTGPFTHVGTTAVGHIAAWNGSAWTAMAGVLPGHPYTSAVHNGQLYVGGGNPPWVARWEGSSWTTILSGSDGWVYGLGSYGGDLVVTGDFRDLGAVDNDHLVFWDGLDAYRPGGGVDGIVDTSAPVVFGGDLYVSGRFRNAGSTPCAGIARWDGTAWHPLGDGLDLGALALVVHGGALYAFGNFTTAGGSPAAHAARWDGTAWHPLGAGTNGIIYSACSTDRGIVVAGPFSTAGGRAAAGIAIYNPDLFAREASWTMAQDATLNAQVRTSDAGGSPLAASVVVQPAHGALDLDGSGTCSYTPVNGFIGQDRFSFIGTGAGGVSNTARVTITVAPTGNEPALWVAEPLSAEMATTASQVHVAGNAADDVAVTSISYTLSGATIAHGSLTAAPTWSLWTPTLGYGITEVTITAADADGHQASARVTITRRHAGHGGSSDGPLAGLGCAAGGTGILMLGGGLLAMSRRRRASRL